MIFNLFLNELIRWIYWNIRGQKILPERDLLVISCLVKFFLGALIYPPEKRASKEETGNSYILVYQILWNSVHEMRHK